MTSKFIIEIDKCSEHPFIGNKARNIDRLIRDNYSVPKTYCITFSAYDYFMRENNLYEYLEHKTHEISRLPSSWDEFIKETFVNSALPDTFHHELQLLNMRIGIASKLAIRSSSSYEDLRGASFAGLHDSFLNVEGFDQLQDSIKLCWASLWNSRTFNYREKYKLDHSQAAMAVIIQEMVSAKYSGVVFTKHPTSPEDNGVIIEYCEGLGENLVAGTITPFAALISRNNMTVEHIRSPKIMSFSDEHLKELFHISLDIEKTFGCAQDIEWAWDGSRFYLLQARPITSIRNFSSPLLIDIWTRANIGEVLPAPVTPLTWRVFLATLVNRPEVAFDSSLFETVERDSGIRLINGLAYIRLDRFLDSFCYLPFVTPEILNTVLGVPLDKSLVEYRPPRGLLVRVAQGLFLLSALDLFDRISCLANGIPRRPDPGHASVESLITWSAKCFRIHLKATAYAVGAFALLKYLTDASGHERLSGCLALLNAGNGYQTANQGIHLLELAKWIKEKPEIHAFLKERHPDEFIHEQELTSMPGGNEFLSMFIEFMSANGARTAGEFELAAPRWREDPSFVVGVISSLASSDMKSSAGSSSHDEASHVCLPAMGYLRGLVFRHVLGVYKRLVVMRENLKYRLMEGYADLRDLFLKKGRELAMNGLIFKAEDVFFLTPQEIRQLEASHSSWSSFMSVIERRRKSNEMWEKCIPADPVAIDGSLVCAGTQGDRLLGIGCSVGIASGQARVLTNISDSRSLKPGEILVTRNTDPGWTPLFLICKAVVTETGGFLSHGATVAREYGIPAVSSLKGATDIICTGDILHVNGQSGEVIIMRSSI